MSLQFEAYGVCLAIAGGCRAPWSRVFSDCFFLKMLLIEVVSLFCPFVAKDAVIPLEIWIQGTRNLRAGRLLICLDTRTLQRTSYTRQWYGGVLNQFLKRFMELEIRSHDIVSAALSWDFMKFPCISLCHLDPFGSASPLCVLTELTVRFSKSVSDYVLQCSRC